MAAAVVLSEDEALELVAFLVTAARTQVDEAAEYGSLRLLTAVGRLADNIADRVSPETRALLIGPLKQVPDLAVRTRRPGALGRCAGPRLPRGGPAPGHPLRPRSEGVVTNPVLEAIRTRRMARALTDEPIERAQLEEVLRAARQAPSAGNRRLHCFVAVQVQDPLL